MKLIEKDKLRSEAQTPSTQAPQDGRSSDGFLVSLLNLALAAGDMVALNLAFLFSYYLRYELELGGEIPGEFDVSYPDYVPVQLAMAAILMVTFVLKGMYRMPRSDSWLGELSTILNATSVGVMLLFAAVSMARYPASSRALFIYFWALAIVAVATSRGFHGILSTAFHRRGVGIKRVLIVGGNNELGRRIMHSIATERSAAARVVGFVDIEPCEDFGRFRCLGTVEQVSRIIWDQRIDEVVIALPAESHDHILLVMSQCNRRGVSARLVPDLYQMRLNRVDVDTVNGIPLIALSEVQIKGWNLVVKRVMDVMASLAVLTVLSPILALTALAIKLESPGPILFRQTRVGKDGEQFTCFKFRSMRKDAEAQLQELLAMNEVSGPIFKIKDDPRMTRVGKFIRRTSLDEIPQLLNVLRGEMSLVGPRPPLPEEVANYEEWHLRRLEASPGMTGLWQVSGRSVVPFDEMVMLDIYYIENWSLGLDLRILLRTIPAVLTGGGAF